MDVMNLIPAIPNPNIPALEPGDTVKVSTKIVESGKERIQVFQGVVIKLRGGGAGSSFTVRHVAYGIGVERTFPFGSPLVDKVEVVRHGRVRRAKLYYLRNRSGKAARIKQKRTDNKGAEVPSVGEAQPEPVAEVMQTQPVVEAPVAEKPAEPKA